MLVAEIFHPQIYRTSNESVDSLFWFLFRVFCVFRGYAFSKRNHGMHRRHRTKKSRRSLPIRIVYCGFFLL